MVLCVFIERETHNFILKFRELFPWRETALRAHGMKSDENQFFCQIYATFWGKKMHILIHRYFSLLLKGLEEFSQPGAITDSPFNDIQYNTHLIQHACQMCWLFYLGGAWQWQAGSLFLKIWHVSNIPIFTILIEKFSNSMKYNMAHTWCNMFAECAGL